MSKPGRPRNADLDRDLLLATQSLLAEVGYDRLTIDAVAGHCGTAKTTVYRRWPGKPELVADAIALLHSIDPVPDTGDLRADLVALAAAWHDPDSRRDAVVGGLLTAMNREPALREAVRAAITTPHLDAFAAIVARAADRGEIATGHDLGLIGSLFPALTFHRITVQAEPVDSAFIERVIDGLVLPALAAPPLGVIS